MVPQRDNGVVIRQQKAYPVYDVGYCKAVSAVKAWLGHFST